MSRIWILLFLVSEFSPCFLRIYIILNWQVSDIFSECSFKVFADALDIGGIIKALCVPTGAEKFSNTTLKKGDIYNEAIRAGAKGLPFLKVIENGNGAITL